MAPKAVKIVRFHALGGPEVLKVQDEPIPEPGRGEVRLRVTDGRGARVIFDPIAGMNIELLA